MEVFGRKSKKGRKVTGLRLIKQQAVAWYMHAMKNKSQKVTVSACIGYRTHKNRKDKNRSCRSLLGA